MREVRRRTIILAAIVPIIALLVLLAFHGFKPGAVGVREESEEVSGTRSEQVNPNDTPRADGSMSTQRARKPSPSTSSRELLESLSSSPNDALAAWIRARDALRIRWATLPPADLFDAVASINRDVPTNAAMRAARAYSLGYLAWAVHLEPSLKNQAMEILHRALADVEDPFYQSYALFALYGLDEVFVSFHVEGGGAVALTPYAPLRVGGEWVADVLLPPVDPDGSVEADSIKAMLVRFATASQQEDVNSSTRLLSLRALSIVDHNLYSELLGSMDLNTFYQYDLARVLVSEGSADAIEALRGLEQEQIRQGVLIPSISSELIQIGQYTPEVGQAASALIQDSDPGTAISAAQYLSAALRSPGASEVEPLVASALARVVVPAALEEICRGIRAGNNPSFVTSLRLEWQRTESGFRRQVIAYVLEAIDPEWVGRSSLLAQIDELQSQIAALRADPEIHDRPHIGATISSLTNQARGLRKQLDAMK